MTCKKISTMKKYFHSAFSVCLQCQHSLCSSLSTRAGNQPYGKASPYSCLLSIPPPISTVFNTHSAIQKKSRVSHRDAMASGTIGHCRVGDHSRCLSLFLCCSLTQSSRRCMVSTHARASLWALWWSTLTKMYSYRSCLWRLSISVVSAGRGQSWLVTRSGSTSTGQTINLSCVPADSWTYSSLNALFF